MKYFTNEEIPFSCIDIIVETKTVNFSRNTSINDESMKVGMIKF